MSQLSLDFAAGPRLPHDLPRDRSGARLAATYEEALSLFWPTCLEQPCKCDVCQEPARITAEMLAAAGTP